MSFCILYHIDDVFGSEFGRFFSPSAHLLVRSVRTHLFFLGLSNSGRLSSVLLDFSMFFSSDVFGPGRLILRSFPPSEPSGLFPLDCF